MIEKLSNTQLMVLYLGSKSLIEQQTEFDFSDHESDPHQIINHALTVHAKEKPAIYNRISTLSQELKNRNFTNFRGWYDFSNWENFHHFVIKVYENKFAGFSFSLN